MCGWVFDRVTGYGHSALMTKVYTMFKEPINKVTNDWNEVEASSGILLNVKGEI